MPPVYLTGGAGTHIDKKAKSILTIFFGNCIIDFTKEYFLNL
jgi:hypothetical protein